METNPMLNLIQKIAGELDLKDFQVNNTVKLMFEEECTIPFVARYRKEMTGSLDEVVLRTIRDRFHYLQELESNKVKYLKVVEEHCSKKPELKGKFAGGQVRRVSPFQLKNLHGAAFGQVLAGFDLNKSQQNEFFQHLDALGYQWQEETENLAYQTFLN